MSIRAEAGEERKMLQMADLLFAGLLFLFVFLSCNASLQESVTIDEFRHLSTGVYSWQSGDYSFDSATPPLWKMVMALPAYLEGAQPASFRQLPPIAAGWEPWFVATDFMRDNRAGYHRFLQHARLVNILAGAACLVFLYIRCRKSFGTAAALYGTAFLAFSPTFLAHAHYATTDTIATLTIMATVFLVIDQLNRPGLLRIAGIALLFSMALLCKYTALLLVPLLVLVPLSFMFQRQGKETRAPLAIPAIALLVCLLIPLLTINAFYGFHGTGIPLKEMKLRSRALTGLAYSPAGSVPLPLPRAFIEGFDKQKADSDYSEFPAYLGGTWSADGFRSYYLAGLCLKESLPFLLLIAAALIGIACRKGAGFSRTSLLLWLYLPVTLFVVLSFMNKLNMGVRYLLPAYPFFGLFIAGLYRQLSNRRGAQLALCLLFVLHLASVFRVSPHYTSYFNELAGGAETGYRHLIDSNIDWGQDLPALKKLMAERGIETVQLAYFGHALPEAYGIRYQPLSLPPKPGYVAISASLLQGQPYLLTYVDPPREAEMGQFTSLQNLQPVARAGYSILIFRIH